MDAPLRLLLGPQRPVINLDTAIERAGLGDRTIGVISSGWQEAEGDIDQIRELVPNTLFDVQLYRRAEALLLSDEAMQAAYSERQRRLKQQQDLYRLRLNQLTQAARDILTAIGDKDAIAEERRHAISQLRALDRHHLRQLGKINQAFDERFNRDSHAELRQYIEAVEEDLADCDTVMVTGGNVMILLNRLQLFGLGDLLKTRHVVAWSAGAMALSERIVLFHDRMPQGRREPEVIGQGLGLLPDIVLLPDARNRLVVDDRARIGLFSRRFSPSVCLTLDSGSLLTVEGASFVDSSAVKHLTRQGAVSRVNAAGRAHHAS